MMFTAGSKLISKNTEPSLGMMARFGEETHFGKELLSLWVNCPASAKSHILSFLSCLLLNTKLWKKVVNVKRNNES